MIDATGPEIERARVRTTASMYYAGKPVGLFAFRLGSTIVNVIADDGDEMAYLEMQLPGPCWEHVSVSVSCPGPPRCPTWDEMCMVKRFFWKPEECVLQFHPPESEYINTHPFTLHLWRLVGVNHPTPPKVLV